MGLRGWPAWLGLWAGGVVGLLGLLMALEAPDVPLRTASDQVTASRFAIEASPWLSLLLVPWLVGLLAWVRRPLLLRLCLLPGALGLVLAAVVFRGVPDVGPWQPWACLGFAALAVAGAVLGTGLPVSPEDSRVATRLAGVGLALVGLIAAAFGWAGLEYQGWFFSPGVTGVMWLGLVGGALVFLLGIVGGMLPDRWWTRVPVTLLLLVLGLASLVSTVLWMSDLPLLDRHEETESGWEALALLMFAGGCLAGAAAMLRRWWSAAALSFTAGGVGCALVVARTPDLWRFMW